MISDSVRTFLLAVTAVAALACGGPKETGNQELPDFRRELAPGEVVVIGDGTYADLSLVISGQGNEDNPIVVKAATPGKAILTGASSITLSGSYLVLEGICFKDLDTSMKSSILTCAKGSSNCRISYCSISGEGSEYSTTDTKWISLYGQHNEVSHCSFIDKRNMGCLFVVWLEDDIVPEHRILNNVFTRPYTHYDENGKALNGQEALRIGTSDYSMQNARCLVAGNHFYNCHGEKNEIISNKSCENVFEGNLFEDSIGMFTFRHGNRCVARSNYFLSNGMEDVGGVRIIGEDHLVEGNVFLNLTGTGYKSALSIVMGESGAAINGYWTVLNPVIKDNVFINCVSAVEVNVKSREAQDSAPRNVLFDSNIIVSDHSSGSLIKVTDTDEDQITWKDNTLFGCRFDGVSLRMADKMPSLKDYSAEIESIRKNAGN